MSAKRLLTIAIASVVLIGGVAAVGAATPADQAHDDTQVNENATDGIDEMPGENATAELPTEGEEIAGQHADDEGPTHADSVGGPAAGGDVGPEDGHPSAVPGHVSEIHDTIASFLDGTVGNLGEALSELLNTADGQSG